MSVIRRVGLFGLSLLLIASAVIGTPPASVLAYGKRISSDGGTNDLWPAMAKNPTTGALTAIWRADAGGFNAVRAASSLDNGNTWSPEITLYSGNHGGYLETLRLTHDREGGLHVVFWAGQGLGRQVLYVYHPPGADPREAGAWRFGGNLCVAGPCIEPSLAAAPDGHVYLLYEDTENRLGLRRRLGTAGGWSEVRQIFVDARATGAVAVSPDGQIHITYALRSTRQTFYARYAAFDDWRRLIFAPVSWADTPFVPEIIADTAGNVHLTWVQADEVCYRPVTSGGLGGAECLVGYTDGDQHPSLAVSATGVIYITWGRQALKEVWQNGRVNGEWGDPVRLGADSASGFRTRYQRYGVAWDGEVDIVLVENGHTRYQRIEAGVRDRQGPSVTALAWSGTPIGQRASATVSGADTAETGLPSGITRIEYSLDGQHFVAASRDGVSPISGAPTTITARAFDIDLADPGAGGDWGTTAHGLSVRLIDAKGNVGPATVLAGALQHAVPAATTSRYLAEGYTGGSFDEYLTLANPSASETIYVAVHLQYAGTAAGPPGTLVALQPSQRRTVLIDEVAGPGQELSLRLASDHPFYAERPIYFTAYPAPAGLAYNRPGVAALSGIDGGHLGVPASAPAAAWYFAEGTTRPGFEVYLTIQNPQPAASTVRLTYYFSGSTASRSLIVGAGQRRTVVVHSPDASQGGIGPDQDFSAKVETLNGQPIIAERVMYFRYAGTITGGTATLGATAPARAWYFAEGTTRPGFDQYLTLQNPDETADATVRISYYVTGGQTPISRDLLVPARSRRTVRVHDAPTAGPTSDNPGGLGRNYDNSTTVEAIGGPAIVVERPIYFTYSGPTLSRVDGGHNVMGATGLIAPGQGVVLAEGYTGPGFEQYLTFQNPNPQPVSVTITYLTADGQPLGPYTVHLPATQRTTIAVHRADDPSGAGLGPGQEFATQVAVAPTASGGILVERVMYFRYAGSATGGFSAFGAPAP